MADLTQKCAVCGLSALMCVGHAFGHAVSCAEVSKLCVVAALPPDLPHGPENDNRARLFTPGEVMAVTSTSASSTASFVAFSPSVLQMLAELAKKA